MAIQERIANGETPDEARAAAIRELGNLSLIQDVTRTRRGIVRLENVLHDTRYALRQLRRAPGFTITVLLTLAIGIGANLAVFQLVHGVILAKLPIPHPDEIVSVQAAKTPFDQAWMVSYAAFQRLRASTGADAPLGARTGFGSAILQRTSNDASNAVYELISDNFFSVLGVRAAAGRLFIQSDAAPGQSEWPAVLRYDFARDTFGSAQRALGVHVQLNGIPVVIVGVADPRFAGLVTGYAPDFWLPLEAQSTHLGIAFDSLGPGHGVNLDKPWINQPTIFWPSLVARIPPDRELMTAATVDSSVKSSLLRATLQMVPADHGIGGIRRGSSNPLYLLMALSASIFLVGCLNLANLQLARLSTRAHEFGIRMALGANRSRLIGQVLIEDAILVLLGGTSAFLVGRTASAILIRWASSRDWILNVDLHPNLPVIAVGVALMLLALVAFSIMPAIVFIRTGLAQAAGSRAKISGLAHTGQQRWRAKAMLAAQVSLSLLLTAMSGCFAATLVHWETIDLGMDRDHVLSVDVDMRRTGYASRHPDWTGLYREIKSRLEALPQVRAASVEMCSMPDCGWNTALYVFGRSDQSNVQVHGKEDHVGPGFFSTIGIPLLRGRDFADTDTDKSQTVAILSRSYARQLFGNENPIGHRVGYEPAPNDHKFLIVGEVADAHVDGPQYEAPPVVYMSINQNPFPIHTIQVRTTGDPQAISDRIRTTIRQIDPDLPISEIVPLSTEMNDGLGTDKLLARLAAVYATLTLLLVSIGFYGVMSSRTSRRKSEFGIRLALGATRRHVHMLIVRQTAGILFAGIAPGLLLSAAAMRLARHLLFGSSAANSAAIIGSGVILVMAGALATILPARRAGLADPLDVLRSE